MESVGKNGRQDGYESDQRFIGRLADALGEGKRLSVARGDTSRVSRVSFAYGRQVDRFLTTRLVAQLAAASRR